MILCHISLMMGGESEGRIPSEDMCGWRCEGDSLGSRCGLTPGKILIDLGDPWTIQQIRRNRISMSKYNHVLHIFGKLPDSDVFPQDRAAVEEMG